MLNPLPQLLVYGFFAPTVLRLVAAGVFFYLAYFHFTHKREAAHEISIFGAGMAVAALNIYILLEALIGLGLLFGFWTQIAALVGLIICVKILFIKRSLHAIAPYGRLVYVLIAVICLSLILSGAGAIAIDLPL